MALINPTDAKEDMDIERAREFTEGWLRNWNAHDLDAILTHYADDVVFTSPIAKAVSPETDGVLRGKVALREYWREGLRRIPDLRFELVNLYVGVHSLVINYRNQRGGLVNEVLIFDGDQVVSGHGTYLDPEGNPAGLTTATPDGVATTSG